VSTSFVSQGMTMYPRSDRLRGSSPDGEAGPAGKVSRAIWTVEEYVREVGCSEEELRRSAARLIPCLDCPRLKSEQPIDG
jgi:hypothetical protein